MAGAGRHQGLTAHSSLAGLGVFFFLPLPPRLHWTGPLKGDCTGSRQSASLRPPKPASFAGFPDQLREETSSAEGQRETTAKDP